MSERSVKVMRMYFPSLCRYTDQSKLKFLQGFPSHIIFYLRWNKLQQLHAMCKDPVGENLVSKMWACDPSLPKVRIFNVMWSA